MRIQSYQQMKNKTHRCIEAMRTERKRARRALDIIRGSTIRPRITTLVEANVARAARAPHCVRVREGEFEKKTGVELRKNTIRCAESNHIVPRHPHWARRAHKVFNRRRGSHVVEPAIAAEVVGAARKSSHLLRRRCLEADVTLKTEWTQRAPSLGRRE